MLLATMHRRPMMNGTSGFAPPEYLRIASVASANPIPDAFLDRLQRMGCELVIVHADFMTQATRPWLAREIARGRIAFVRRFDGGIVGDWVFRIGGARRGAAEGGRTHTL